MSEKIDCVLTLATWCEVQRFKAKEVTFPVGTVQAIQILEDCGISISIQGIERILKAMGMTVPTIGRTRAWGLPQLTRLRDFIVEEAEGADGEEDLFASVPSWMKPLAAVLWYQGISADAWAQAHMEYLRTHIKPEIDVDEEGNEVERWDMWVPWHAIPEGAVLMTTNSRSAPIFAFVPETDVRQHLAPALEAATKEQARSYLANYADESGGSIVVSKQRGGK